LILVLKQEELLVHFNSFWHFFRLFWQPVNATLELLRYGARKEMHMNIIGVSLAKKPLRLAMIAGNASTLWWLSKGKGSYRRFFVASVFGRLPCALLLTFIGAYGFQMPLRLWLFLGAGLMFLFLTWQAYASYNHIASDAGALCYATIRWLANCYLALFRLSCKVKGSLVLPAGPKILVANHPNATDTFFLPFILPERPYLLMQGNLFNLPILGWLLTRAGQIPVRAERRERAFDKACELLRQGRTIMLFPEGKLNPSGIPMQTRTGAVRMSLAIGVPIIPIGIHVSQKDTLQLGYRSKTGLRTGRWQVRGCCSFQFGERWDPGCESVPGQAKVRARYLTELLMKKIYTLAQAASEECNP